MYSSVDEQPPPAWVTLGLPFRQALFVLGTVISVRATHAVAWLVRGEVVLESWPIDLRGWG